jgi:hypothetical protein
MALRRVSKEICGCFGAAITVPSSRENADATTAAPTTEGAVFSLKNLFFRFLPYFVIFKSFLAFSLSRKSLQHLTITARRPSEP